MTKKKYYDLYLVNLFSAPNQCKTLHLSFIITLRDALLFFHFTHKTTEVQRSRRTCKTHTAFGVEQGPSVSLLLAQAPETSLPLAPTLQICLEMTGDCVAGPG